MPLMLQSQDSISFQVIFQPTSAAALVGSITFTMVRGFGGHDGCAGYRHRRRSAGLAKSDLLADA